MTTLCTTEAKVSSVSGKTQPTLEEELEAQLASLSLQDLPSPPLPLDGKNKTELNTRKKETPVLA